VPSGVGMTSTSTIEIPTSADDVDSILANEDLWAVIVWNDNVTTFQTVIKAFVEIFGHTAERSEQLAWRIHRTGKAVVAVRPKAEAESGVHRLHQRKIQASIAPA
jgi:ATP-dependent Clp protease adaptor protein ClpS